MGTLGNPQHERFAQEFHRLVWTGGKPKPSRVAAYIAAGYETKGDFVADNARKLANRIDVKARLAELADYAAKLAGIDAGWAQVKLKGLVDCNLDDYLATPNANGVRRLDLSKVPRDKLGLLVEIAQDEWHTTQGDEEESEPVIVRKVRIKRADPIAALGLMAKIAGWLAAEKTEHSGGLTLESLVGQSFENAAEPKKEIAGA